MEIVLFLVPLAIVLAVALVLNYRDARNTFNFLTADEVQHSMGLGNTWADRALDAAAASRPQVTFVPDGFTCLSCRENPALPYRIWCAVCMPLSERHFRSEPIERGQR